MWSGFLALRRAISTYTKEKAKYGENKIIFYKPGYISFYFQH